MLHIAVYRGQRGGKRRSLNIATRVIIGHSPRSLEVVSHGQEGTVRQRAPIQQWDGLSATRMKNDKPVDVLQVAETFLRGSQKSVPFSGKRLFETLASSS